MEFLHHTENDFYKWVCAFVKKPSESTKYIILSIFAKGDETLEPSDPKKWTESELQYSIGKCGFDFDDPEAFKGPDENKKWRQGLEGAEILKPKPIHTSATVDLVYILPKSGHKRIHILSDMMIQTLKGMLGIFGIEQSFFHALCRNSDTWYSVQRENGRYGFLLINRGLYSVVCSFSKKDRETTLIVSGQHVDDVDDPLRRKEFRLFSPEWSFPSVNLGQSLRDTFLRGLQPHHLHHPLTFALWGFIDNLFSVERWLDRLIDSIDKLKEPLENGAEDEESKSGITNADKVVSNIANKSTDAKDAMMMSAALFEAIGVAELELKTLKDAIGIKTWFFGKEAHNEEPKDARYDTAAA